MRGLYRLVERLAPSDLPVLITGETGSGKELVALSLHARSKRSGPFIPVNCAALPETLAESELFGHERGAFTGATAPKAGWFEAANGGTLFLDEVGELPLPLQAKLLRAQMQGAQMQGGTLANGATAAETPLTHRYHGWFGYSGWMGPAHIEQGQLVVQGPDGRTLSGQDLVGLYIPADRGSTSMWTVITAVNPDPTFPQGGTSLYSVDVFDPNGVRSSLCRPDASGVAAAIPVAAAFNTHGDRVESTASFTFGCTVAVIAKCYRWGYRPWLTGSSYDFAQLHWACTRLARADYCGNGQSWTHDGTLINVWDRAPAPGTFQDHGTPPPDFFFEAGWSTHGAVCLSKQRWATLPPAVAQSCPDRLITPGASTGVGTVCNSEGEAVLFDAKTQLFNESRVNH